ncbi:hypothetical protein EPN83_01955 [Patescibacteria group bacterium]|nr:MAG: hypothetical protein EPN83_01955 [Patescibacteria group bacterium]
MEPQKPKTSAKDFFLHLGTMVALYSGTVALLNLLFRIINVAYPPVERYLYFGSSSVSLPVATLIVVFPLFLFLANILQKSYAADPSRKEYAVRRWLIYITLFVAGIVLTGDLVTLVYFFLDGRELTAGFLLKVLSVFVVTGSIFGYYLDDLRGRLTGGRRNVWRIIAAVLVVSSIVAGFGVIGTPRNQRLMRYDEQKIADLQSVQGQITQYWQQKGALPGNLDELRDPLSYFSIPVDPQSGESYVYRKTGAQSFELCANFNLDSRGYQSKPGYAGSYYYGDLNNKNWAYKKGQYCLQRMIDPERHPVAPKPVR